MDRPGDFPRAIQELALVRQQNLCASCGVTIFRIGEAGRLNHKFGEGAQAHHVKHVKFGGMGELSNCVILCRSCHYNAHEGGNYRSGTVIGKTTDFPFYNGKRG